MIQTFVFNGHNNSFTLTAMEGKSTIDLVDTSVSRVIVRYGTENDSVVDSDDDASAFDWLTNGANGDIEFSFGALDLPEANHTCSLVIYDPLHTNGQVWYQAFRMHVRGNIEPT